METRTWEKVGRREKSPPETNPDQRPTASPSPRGIAGGAIDGCKDLRKNVPLTSKSEAEESLPKGARNMSLN